MVHHASWRWLFLVNLPLCAFAWWRLRALGDDDRPHPAEGKPDVAGIVLFALAMSAGLTWLSWGGHRFAWTSATSLALCAAAAFAASRVPALHFDKDVTPSIATTE